MNNYKIIFRDGTTEFVSRDKYFALVKESGNPASKSFLLRNNRYEFSDIRRMVEPKEDAMGFDFTKMLKIRTPEKRKKALEAMIRGMSDHQETDKSKDLLKLMKLTLAKTE